MKRPVPTEIKVFNPHDGKLVGAVKKNSAAEIRATVEKARAAFKQHRGLSSFARHKILKGACELLLKGRNEIAELITRETGKPIKESHIEVDRASFVLEQSAEESMRIGGEIFSCDVTAAQIDKKCFTWRRPVGVIAAITPYNFPLNIPAHKVGPALAAGNAVILKPSPSAPLTALKLKEVLIAAGLPEELLSIVHGFKEEVETLCSSDVNMVTFTGGTAAGENIARIAGMKKVSLELGDNGALIVLEDGNIPVAVKTAIDQRFRTGGQRCTAVKRVFVHRSIYKEFAALLCAEAKKLKRGNPLEPDVDLCALISEPAAIVVEARIKDAVKRGGKILLGGKREKNFIPPTVIENVPEDSDLVAEETFGPVLPLFPFDAIDDLIERVNASQFGLQAGVFTNKLDVIKKLSRELEVVTLVANDGPGFRIESIPFGGMKKSGMGREGVHSAVEEMTEAVNLIF